ncbi:MAG TPA: hypothetical protein VHQ70_00720, partial [Syntrophomonadaceae bacterium]|nr:hypothetical protein [Syntrophomonadaceae bacterium]
MKMLFKKITLFILSFCFLMIMIPVPAAAASNVWDGTTIDTSWYNADDTQFTLTKAAELAGVADLVYQGNTFAGITITLGEDILLNST